LGFIPGDPPLAFVARLSAGGAHLNTTILGDTVRMSGMDAQPDGKVLVAGYEELGDAAGENGILVRVLPDGELDPSFGEGGRFTLDLDRTDELSDVAVQPNGEIVASGVMAGDAGTPRSFVLRVSESGVLDPTFGSSGVAFWEGGSILALGPIAVAGDGTIIVAGTTRYQGNTVPVVLRFFGIGRVDTGFGRAGLALLEQVEDPAFPNRLTFDAEGRILVAGQAGDVVRFFVARVLL
jgi:uncharacterized delta-60 repeat protein